MKYVDRAVRLAFAVLMWFYRFVLAVGFVGIFFLQQQGIALEDGSSPLTRLPLVIFVWLTFEMVARSFRLTSLIRSPNGAEEKLTKHMRLLLAYACSSLLFIVISIILETDFLEASKAFFIASAMSLIINLIVQLKTSTNILSTRIL